MRKLIAVTCLAVGAALSAAPPASAEPGPDLKTWVSWPGGGRSGVLWVPLTGDTRGSFGVTGPANLGVTFTVDLSRMDHSHAKATVLTICTQEGMLFHCGASLSASGSAQLSIQVEPAPGVSPGPGGFISATVKPNDGEDPNPANNKAQYELDITNHQTNHYTVNVGDAGGAVGETVSVPVTVTSKGPNTLRGVVLSRPSGGGGKDFAGGDGCVLTPIPQCNVDGIPPGASRTINLKFHIRRCYQPTASDPEYGSPVDGDVPVSGFGQQGISIPILDKPSDTRFRIIVAGCQQKETWPAPAAQPTMAAAPATLKASAIASQNPSPDPSTDLTAAQAAPAGDGGLTGWQQGTLAAGAASLVLLLWRRGRTLPK